MAARRAAELKRQVLEATAKVGRVMEENDVFFNGAREERTQQSALGIAQSWSIKHLDNAKYADNARTLDLIAKVLKQYPELFCEVKGTTSGQGKREADPNLASHFGLDAVRDYARIMDKLAEERALACRSALLSLGVAESQLLPVTFEGCTGEQKVDFIPRAEAPKGWAKGGRRIVKGDGDDEDDYVEPPPTVDFGEDRLALLLPPATSRPPRVRVDVHGRSGEEGGAVRLDGGRARLGAVGGGPDGPGEGDHQGQGREAPRCRRPPALRPAGAGDDDGARRHRRQRRRQEAVTFDGDKPKPAERPGDAAAGGRSEAVAADGGGEAVAHCDVLVLADLRRAAAGARDDAHLRRCRAVSVPNLDATEREARKHANAAAVTANAHATAAHAVALKTDPKAKAPEMAKVYSPRPSPRPAAPLTAPATPASPYNSGYVDHPAAALPPRANPTRTLSHTRVPSSEHKTSFNDCSDHFLKLRLLVVVVPADAHVPPQPNVEAPIVEAAGEKKTAEAQKRDGGGETAAEKVAAEALRTTVTDAKAAAATKAAATAETAAEAKAKAAEEAKAKAAAEAKKLKLPKVDDKKLHKYYWDASLTGRLTHAAPHSPRSPSLHYRYSSSLSNDEFQKLALEIANWLAAPPKLTMQQLVAAFKFFDTDNSNAIDLRELPPAMQKLGFRIDWRGATELLRQFDVSRDGKLQFEEFINLVANLARWQCAHWAAVAERMRSPGVMDEAFRVHATYPGERRRAPRDGAPPPPARRPSAAAARRRRSARQQRARGRRRQRGGAHTDGERPRHERRVGGA